MIDDDFSRLPQMGDTAYFKILSDNPYTVRRVRSDHREVLVSPPDDEQDIAWASFDDMTFYPPRDEDYPDDTESDEETKTEPENETETETETEDGSRFESGGKIYPPIRWYAEPGPELVRSLRGPSEEDVQRSERSHKMLHLTLDYRIKAMRAAAQVLTGKNDAKGFAAPGGATPPSVGDTIALASWLIDEDTRTAASEEGEAL